MTRTYLPRLLAALVAATALAGALVVTAQAAPGGSDPNVEPVPAPEYVDDARSFVAGIDFANAGSGTASGVVIANVVTPGTGHLRRDVVVRSEGGGQLLRSATMPHPAVGLVEGPGIAVQPGRYEILVPFDTAVETIRMTQPAGATIAVVDTTPAVAAFCAQSPDDPGCRHDLGISITPVPDPVPASTTLRYRVGVGNAGPGPAFGTSARIQLPLPAADPLPAGCTRAGTTLTCTFRRIHPGATRTVELAVPVPAGFLASRGQRGTVGASGSVAATGGRDANRANDATTVTSGVVAVSDLGVTKTGSRPTATANDPVVYTVGVTNIGPSDADDVVVTDRLPDPAEGAFTSATASDGGTCAPDAARTILRCTWPTPLTVGASRSVAVTVTVTDTGAADRITDQAGATSVSVDPVPGNDTASVTTRVIAVPTTVVATPIVTRVLPGVDLYVLVLTAKLTRTDTGRPVVGRLLEFRATNGTLLCSARTDTTGEARCPGLRRTLLALLGFGYQVNWAGDGRYLPGSGKGAVVRIGG